MTNPSTKSVCRKLNKIKISANKRSKDFNLSKECCENILKQTICQYTGKPFYGVPKSGNSISFERLNNDIGYVDGNVIPVCVLSNNIKSDYNSEELFEEYVNYIVKIKSYEQLIIELNNSIEKRTNLKNNKIKELEESQNTTINALKNGDTKIKNRTNHESTLITHIKNNISSIKTIHIQLKDIKKQIKFAKRNAEIIIGVLEYERKYKKSGFIGRAKLKLGLSLDATITDSIDSFMKSDKTWRDFI